MRRWSTFWLPQKTLEIKENNCQSKTIAEAESLLRTFPCTSATLRRMPWTCSSRVRSIDHTLHTNWTPIPLDPIASIHSTLNQDPVSSPRRRWFSRSYIWLTWRVLRELRRPEPLEGNLSKQDTLIRVFHIWSRSSLPYPIGRETMFHIGKLPWPISWEIHLVATARLWSLQTSSARSLTLRKRSRRWNSRQEWWRSRMKQ